MTQNLDDRLNQILPRIISDDFLAGKGLSNDIAFFIFDYPAEEELRIREHIQFLLGHAPKQRPGLRIKHLNLLDFMIEVLEQRKLLDKSFAMQKAKGDDFLLKQLEKILHPNKIVDAFAEAVNPAEHDLVLLSGTGSVWPVIRSHSLLNNLHSIMGDTPLVLFFPGKYDQKSLQLFGRVPSKNYYRAFRLIP
jgi:hypothetical protein